MINQSENGLYYLHYFEERSETESIGAGIKLPTHELVRVRSYVWENYAGNRHNDFFNAYLIGGGIVTFAQNIDARQFAINPQLTVAHETEQGLVLITSQLKIPFNRGALKIGFSSIHQIEEKRK